MRRTAVPVTGTRLRRRPSVAAPSQAVRVAPARAVRPDPEAPRVDWVGYAMSQGMSREDADTVDTCDLVRLYTDDDDA